MSFEEPKNENSSENESEQVADPSKLRFKISLQRELIMDSFPHKPSHDESLGWIDKYSKPFGDYFDRNAEYLMELYRNNPESAKQKIKEVIYGSGGL